MRTAVILALAMAALIASGGSADSALRGIDRERIAADLPVVDGSTSTRPLRMLIVCAVLDVPCAWQELFDGSRRVLPPLNVSIEPFDAAVPTSGTHGSYVALAEGRADLILTARMPTDDEVRLAASNGVGFEITPIALDAFVFLVNASNPVEGLDLDQVQDIFSGAITDRAEVGGDARPIQPYQRNETSGSQVLMERLVMAGTPMIDAPDLMLMSMMGPFDAISHDPDGIRSAAVVTAAAHTRSRHREVCSLAVEWSHRLGVTRPQALPIACRTALRFDVSSLSAPDRRPR